MLKFIDNPCPWNIEKVDRKIKTFLNEDDARFKELGYWVLEDDKDYIKTDGKIIPSIKYGIPTLYSGNIEDANFYLCLNNPGTFTKVKEFYLYLEKKDNDEYTINDYNELEQELDRLKKELGYLKGIEVEEELELKEYCYKQICNDDNILYREVVLNNKYFESNTEISKKEMYYIYTYFKGLLSKEIDEKSFVKQAGKLINEKINLDKEDFLYKLKKLPICNMDWIPYRSPNVSDIKINKERSIEETCASTTFIINSIINRIIKEENKPAKDGKTLIFFFRRYDKYYKDLLEEQFNKIDAAKNIDYNKIAEKYFFESVSQNASFTPNNVQNVVSKEKITLKEYKDIQKSIVGDIIN